MDLKKYLARFMSVIGVLTGLLFALPLLSQVTPGQLASYFFPPLGTYQIAWLALVSLLGAIVILSPYYFLTKWPRATDPNKRMRVFLIVGLSAFLALVLYFVAVQTNVREVCIPTENKCVSVSVGSKRTEFAEKNFSQDGDWTMLEKAGFEEQEIRKLWTIESILISRVWLFGSYVWLFCSFMAVGSFAVLCDLLDHP